MAGVMQNVMVDVDSRPLKFDGEPVAGSAHNIPVGIDHEGGGEAGEIVASGKSETITQGGRRTGVVSVHRVENQSGMRKPTMIAHPPLNVSCPRMHGMEEPVGKDDTAQVQPYP